MSSTTEPTPIAPPPWKLKATIYTFMMYVSSKDARVLAADKSFLYSPLEASSDFAKDKFIGGLGMVQVIRYTDSPAGPYDEFLMMPGFFEYNMRSEEKNGKQDIVKKKNARVTRIYVSQKVTCWNGRMNWNIPKHLARFTFTNLPDNAIAITVYPHDGEDLPSESSPSSTPIFSSIYKPIPYLPNFSTSTSIAKYVGMDLSLVQPPLPEGKGSQGELPGTKQWCQCLPLEYSSKTSLGLWDLKQGGTDERDPLLGRDHRTEESKAMFENFFPGFGRWRVGFKMEDATVEFPEGKYWDGPKL